MSSLQIAAQEFVKRLAELASKLEASHSPISKMISPLNETVQGLPIEVLYMIFVLLAATVILGLFVAPLAGFSTYVERRVAARIQSRIGCNRVGPEGLLQFLADGIKLITKEDTIPAGADQILFRLAPYLTICGAFLSFVCVPFGAGFIVADLNVGLVYLMAISSLVVVGILMAGWASNNKWSLLGAMRAAAQIVSYEIPVGLALMVPVLLVGSLSLQDLNYAQEGGFDHWVAFKLSSFPAPLIAFFVYFIGALAEVNRTPFDLPEAESELVSGYNTEYSGIRWGLFFVAEYANMFLISAIAVTAFLGGWQPSKVNAVFGAGALFFTLFFLTKTISFFVRLVISLAKGKRLFDLLATVKPIKIRMPIMILYMIASVIGAAIMQLFAESWPVTLLFFIAKTYFLVFVIIWIRWTLPRIRIDQMMSLCWKKLVPIAFFCIFWTSISMVMGGVMGG